MEGASLASLIELMGEESAEDGASRDASSFRILVAALHRAAPRLVFPALEALGLIDVVVTFRLDGDMSLVVTGGLSHGPGEVTLRFREEDFGDIEVLELASDRPDPYLFATLDHSWRGRPGRIRESAETVEIRALSTLGSETLWRVQAREGSRTVAEDDLILL